MNRYGYAANDPILYTDPLGLSPLTDGLSEGFTHALGPGILAGGALKVALRAVGLIGKAAVAVVGLTFLLLTLYYRIKTIENLAKAGLLCPDEVDRALGKLLGEALGGLIGGALGGEALDDGFGSAGGSSSTIGHIDPDPDPVPITNPSRLLTAGSDTPNATGDIRSELLDDDSIFYRAYGNESGPIGRFLSPNPPVSSADAIENSALPPTNSAENLATLRVQGGVRIQRSTASEAFGQPGGNPQVELLERANITIIKTQRLK